MMKFVLMLCVLSVLLLKCQSSPVNVVENHERSGRALVQGRQQATGINSVAPATVTDDDDDDEDDDDDDDEPDLGDLVDDDDDDDDDDDEDDDDEEEEDDTPQGQAAPAPAAASDDDDEDDDEDDDYLDRLFDDILGDDDDDEDDDDDDEVVVRPAISSVPVQQTPVVAAPIEDLAPAASNAAVSPAASSSGIADGIDLAAESVAETAAAAGNTADDALGSSNTNSNNEGALSGGDDDEEADDDDDDDDDDDIIGDDVIEARREARNVKNNIIDMPSDAFQQRHNHFIDAIFARINRIVSDNYDPFVVRLSKHAAAALKEAPTTAATTTTTAKSAPYTTRKLKNTKSEPRAVAVTNNMQQDKEQMSEILQTPGHPQQQQQHVANENLTEDNKLLAASGEMRTVSSGSKSTANVAKASTNSVKKPTTSKNSNKRIVKKTVKNNINRQKLKQGSAVYHPQVFSPERLMKSEGTLSGLSSLRRVGNVKVLADPEGRNSTIKAKFTLGPLVLRVEKSFKRGRVTSVKSATARTNEMMGRIKFSLHNDRATLMSIKVQQPKQVEVESKDNHDRTREFVWRRTPKIARLVSQKLKMAAESVFTPQGVEVVHL